MIQDICAYISESDPFLQFWYILKHFAQIKANYVCYRSVDTYTLQFCSVSVLVQICVHFCTRPTRHHCCIRHEYFWLCRAVILPHKLYEQLAVQGRRKQSPDGQAQFGVGGDAVNNSRAKRAAKFEPYYF